MKFGGSSVGAPERVARVVELILSERKASRLAIVVSAMGDTTDWILEAINLALKGDGDGAQEIAERIRALAIGNGTGAYHLLTEKLDISGDAPDFAGVVDPLVDDLSKVLYAISVIRDASPQTTDLVLSFGERVSNNVLALLVDAAGVPACYQDAREWAVTNDRFGDAIVEWQATNRKIEEVSKSWGDRVPLNTGFLGRTPDGRTTTLGRNGSDYTATLLARGLKADEIHIWTDVSGVMTADPGIVDDAYPLERLSYMEALELACFGTKMFHSRTMIPLIESGIPMRIRNTLRPDDHGTVVSSSFADDINRPTSVTSLENLALIDVELRRLSEQSQIGERVLQSLYKRDISVWMTVQAGHGQAIAICVKQVDVDSAVEAIRTELRPELERFELDPIGTVAPVTLLSLVAETMGSTPAVAGRFFEVLGTGGINIRAIAQGATGRSISCVIDAKDTHTAVRSVHSAFNFAHQEVSIFVLGRGVVGGELLEQIRGQRDLLVRDHDIQLNVVGLASSRHLLFDEDGINLASWNEELEKAISQTKPSRDVVRDRLDQFSRLPVPILVDCTGADDMEDLYEEAFAAGVHVVAANKKPLTVSWERREQLMKTARTHHREYHYETSVGASLPVIDTLKNLVRTGDRVHLIEGCFSGTLGYLTNEVMSGVALSESVRVAKELGYTEPNPQDDLSGLDVARKALILARELNLPLTMDDVRVEPLVPANIIETETLDDFFAALKAYDAELEAQLETYRQEGKVLRYIARIDPTAEHEKLVVGPVAVPLDHPAAGLRGSESFVAFTTARYAEYPLIVRGSGAGGAVTAAGVLADVLRISQALRGR